MQTTKTTNPDLRMDLDSKSTSKKKKKKKSIIQPNFSLVEQKLSKIVCRINDAPPDGTDLIVMNKPHIP